MSNNGYEEYLDKWLQGIKDEIYFWDIFLKTKGENCGCSDDVWREVANYAPAFCLEEDIEKSETKFLDVGSGPFSRCGIKTSKTNLNFVAVDPLASIYSILKKNYGIETKIQPQTAMVENLSSKFAENEFDIVHMSNSLDHSFDPILGIWQMLYVCKTGGKLILRHHKNEAENENYNGFHQWNLCIEDGKFIIWRPGIKINVKDILGEYVEIQHEENIRENRGLKQWVYDKVVIQKIKNVPLHFNENYPTLLEKILENICLLNFENYKNSIQEQKPTHKVINILGIKIKYKKRKDK